MLREKRTCERDESGSVAIDANRNRPPCISFGYDVVLIVTTFSGALHVERCELAERNGAPRIHCKGFFSGSDLNVTLSEICHGGEMYDGWSWLGFERIEFSRTKPCGRCEQREGEH